MQKHSKLKVSSEVEYVTRL